MLFPKMLKNPRLNSIPGGTKRIGENATAAPSPSCVMLPGNLDQSPFSLIAYCLNDNSTLVHVIWLKMMRLSYHIKVHQGMITARTSFVS